MTRPPVSRTLSYVIVCAAPFLAAGLAAARPLRLPGVHQALGAVVAATIAFAVWMLARRPGESASQVQRQRAAAGALLLAPFALMALFWVGLGTPWEATARENEMRYLVLAAMAVAETAGFVMAATALAESGERLHSKLALALILLAGPLYLGWDMVMFGAFSARERTGLLPEAFSSLDEVLDALLFVAGTLTYAAGGLLSSAMGRSRLLGGRAAAAYLLVCGVAVALLVRRGLDFIGPAGLAAPWYATPGFIVGIPAVPFIVPALLGAVLLRVSREP